MIHSEPELSAVSLIFVGSFNPQIFQPAWFAAQGLLRENEAETADIAVVHSEVVAFTTESVALEAQRERLAISTKPETDAVEVVRDLAISTLSILRHTPVYSFGINTQGHYLVDEREEYDRLGWTLAPPGPWGDALQRPGMRSLTVQGLRPDERRGALLATVEPSIRIQPHGVFVAVNDHFDVASPGEQAVGASPAVELLTESWEDSRARADVIVKQVLSLV